MSDTAIGPAEIEEQKGRGKPVLLFALVGAVLLGGASFGAVYMGMLPLPFLSGDTLEAKDPGAATAAKKPEGNIESRYESQRRSKVFDSAFVPIQDLVVSLNESAKSRHLKMSLVIETDPEAEGVVAQMTPRILDVLNTFLRAVDERDLVDPAAMTRLRAQMLRRIRLVTPPGSVRDLLIQSFILN